VNFKFPPTEALNYICNGARNRCKATTRPAIFAVLFFVAIAPSVFGQTVDDQPIGGVFVGYSFSSLGPVTLNGWHASVLSQVHDRIGILIDFSGHYVSPSLFLVDLLDDVDIDVPDEADFAFYSYRFGPQIKMFEGRNVTTSAQILFGGNYLQGLGVESPVGVHGFAAAAGGSVDWNIAENIALRIPQFDYNWVRVAGGTLGGFRLSTGIPFRFR
jgi:hypothetical protein